jgi:hypothetical protein
MHKCSIFCDTWQVFFEKTAKWHKKIAFEHKNLFCYTLVEPFFGGLKSQNRMREILIPITF